LLPQAASARQHKAMQDERFNRKGMGRLLVARDAVRYQLGDAGHGSLAPRTDTLLDIPLRASFAIRALSKRAQSRRCRAGKTRGGVRKDEFFLRSSKQSG
jgi:hypothetical protein